MSGWWRTPSVAAVYDLPRPLATHEDWQRLHHLDLEHLTAFELRREQERVRCALAFATDAEAIRWLWQRLRRLGEECARRSGPTGRG